MNTIARAAEALRRKRRAEGDYGCAGLLGQPGESGAEGGGSGFRGVRAGGDAAFAVDEDESAAFVGGCGSGCGCGGVEAAGGALVVAVLGDMALAGEGAARQRDAPQSCGGDDHGLDAEAVQCREDDGRVCERGVVGGDDGAWCQFGLGVCGDGQPRAERQQGGGEAAGLVHSRS
ncbi:hypothetical protein RKD19_008239 [Streptomyces canus]